METRNYSYLLERYMGIWNNRRMDAGDRPWEILEETIKRELKDENTHPRARRTLPEKFLLSTKRIMDSDLTPKDKLQLIQLHIELIERINKENG
ncbi:hypothetical protein [Bacillus sp. REN3]|uniref:hypothetical protein n=1 Tax=Bacillus sp. REN3 TaxID=2802440 RepID=UPI001AEE4BDC|nr:hypothetical protein [Bacillus sp. REN3]